MNDELPPKWTWTTMGDAFQVVFGQSPPSSSYNDSKHGLPFFQGKAEFSERYAVIKKWCNTPKKIAEKDDVLLTIRAPVGPTNLCPERACIGRGLAAIRGVAGVSSLFILYFLRANEQKIARLSTGTTFGAITSGVLKSYPVPLPPLGEQRRIVSRIEQLFTRLDEGVRSLQQAHIQLEQYKQATFQYAFVGKSTKLWREKHQEEAVTRKQIEESHKKIVELRNKTGKRNYENLKEIAGGERGNIPKTWNLAHFEELVYVIDYRGRTPPFSIDGVPILRSSNIKKGIIEWNNLKYIKEKTYHEYMSRGLPEKGDVLFTTEAPLGNLAFIPEGKFAIAQRVVLLRTNNCLLDSKFLYYQIQSELFRQKLFGKGTGTTVTGVSYRNLRELEIVVPPINEQKIIVDFIEQEISIINNVRKDIEDNLIKSNWLKLGVLKTAFEGKLVSQDASDEPAILFLEKIRATKAPRRKTRTQRRLD